MTRATALLLALAISAALAAPAAAFGRTRHDDRQDARASHRDDRQSRREDRREDRRDDRRDDRRAPRRVVRQDRHVIVVQPGFPIHREHRRVVPLRPHLGVRVFPRHYFTPFYWPGVVLPPAPAAWIVWSDTERLDPADEWAETSFDVDRSGRRLDLELGGAVQLDFAEIVFENGETQVVDFAARRVELGHYSLIDLPGGNRRVDHVRLVARALSPDALVSLRLIR